MIAAVLAMCVVAPSYAVDGLSADAGRAGLTDMWRISAQWSWSQRWMRTEQWHLGGFWDLGIAQWERDAQPGQRARIGEIGFTPVFRLQANTLRGPYLEAGVGVHLLSATSLGYKRFSTAFQFGERIGVGYRFGAHGAFDVAYLFQHISNADIKKPNSGADFHQIRLQYWFP